MSKQQHQDPEDAHSSAQDLPDLDLTDAGLAARYEEQQGGDEDPTGDAAAAVVDDTPPALTTRDDGKFQYGSFVGESVEQVLEQVGKAQREANAELTRRMQRDAAGSDPGVADSPAASSEYEEVDDDDYQAWLYGEALRHGFQPPQQQPAHPSQFGAVGHDPLHKLQTGKLVDNELERLEYETPSYRTDQRFRALAEASIGLEDHARLQDVIDRWGQHNPNGAFLFQQQLQQAQQQLQQQQAAQQQAQMMQLSTAQYEAAKAEYYQSNQDHAQLDQMVGQYFQANPMALPTAQQLALQTGNHAAITQVFNMAAHTARQALLQQGGAPAITSQGSDTMHDQQQQIEREKELAASVESGTASDVDVTLRGTGNPGVDAARGDAKASLDALILTPQR